MEQARIKIPEVQNASGLSPCIIPILGFYPPNNRGQLGVGKKGDIM